MGGLLPLSGEWSFRFMTSQVAVVGLISSFFANYHDVVGS